MFKYFILACFCCILSSTVWANTLSQYYYSELTNLDTQGYVWKVELRSNPQGQFDAKLLNPHPKFAVLNQRAMEIAEDYKSVASNTSYYARYSDGKTKINQEPYHVVIKFPLLENESNLYWRNAPRAVINQHELSTICHEMAQSGQVILKWKITTKPNGRIENVIFLSHPQYNDNVQKIAPSLGYKMLRSARIKPRNKDGIPYSVSVIVPLVFNCP